MREDQIQISAPIRYSPSPSYSPSSSPSSIPPPPPPPTNINRRGNNNTNNNINNNREGYALNDPRVLAVAAVTGKPPSVVRDVMAMFDGDPDRAADHLLQL